MYRWWKTVSTCCQRGRSEERVCSLWNAIGKANEADIEAEKCGQKSYAAFAVMPFNATHAIFGEFRVTQKFHSSSTANREGR